MESEQIWNLVWTIGGWVVLVLGILLVLGVITWLAYLRQKGKAYKQYKVFIWKRHKDKDGNEIPIIIGWDKGAIIKDRKLKQWRFHVKRWNIDFGDAEDKDLSVDKDIDIPSIPLERGGECVFVEKLGHRKGALGKPFMFEGNVKVKVSTGDVAEALRSFEINTRTFGKKDNPIWAFVLYIVMAAFVMILILVILNKFELITQASDNLVTASQNFAQANSDVVVSNAPG